MDDQDDLWIFAYGSLMWRPEFTYVDRQTTRVSGYHRGLCVWSYHYRGTPDRPGLVLGLDRGGSCVGVAFRIAPADRDATLAAVRARELITGVYRETTVNARLADGRKRRAVAYVADRTHPQYAGTLDLDAMVARVRTCSGVTGSNADYVRNTHLHLVGLGLEDPHLARVVTALARPDH